MAICVAQFLVCALPILTYDRHSAPEYELYIECGSRCTATPCLANPCQFMLMWEHSYANTKIRPQRVSGLDLRLRVRRGWRPHGPGHPERPRACYCTCPGFGRQLF